MSRVYAGIGSRETPPRVLWTIYQAAGRLALRGWRLHSGGATGADQSFHAGQSCVLGPSTLFLPWRGYNDVERDKLTTVYTSQTDKAMGIAKAFHPNWGACSQGAQKLHARNTHIVLGLDCETPVSMILCWTKDGGPTGGTGQALRIAEHYNIPVFNFWHKDVLNQIAEYLHAQEAAA